MFSSLKSPIRLIAAFCLFYALIAQGQIQETAKLDNINDPLTLTISPENALPIGIKIWFNECNGEINGLTSWNKAESFASLGIGHFVWHPRKNKKRASFHSGFPMLVRHLESQHPEKVPVWLRGDRSLYCPWNSHAEFTKNKNSPRMKELRTFLRDTITLQAECMVRQLQEKFPELLASTPSKERPFIYHQFKTLASTPSGVYALVDYLNFKGAGVSKSHRNYERGSGLLQVIRGMQFSPPGSTPLQAFTWSAKKALLRRVEGNPKERERWVAGWFKRVNTYKQEIT